MKEFDYSVVEDMSLFKVNALPAHSDTKYFRSIKELRAGETSFYTSLNGIWYFHYAKNIGEAVPGFQADGKDLSAWDRIRVPAHIQMEGYDLPAYVNTQYPWDGVDDIEPCQVPKRFNPVASYARDFDLSEKEADGQLRIAFEGVESGFAMWLNGHFVGYSEDSFSRTEFDISDFTRPGKNRLAVQVYKWTPSSWFEDQDMYRFSGIFRDVYIYAVPAAHAEDVKVWTELSQDMKSGRLLAELKLGYGAAAVDYVITQDGVRTAEGRVQAEGGMARISVDVEEPALWSAEKPKLYELFVAVVDADGQVAECLKERTGFRRYEMKDGIMCINGKRIVFHGVNRHEFYTDTGRAGVTREMVEKDIITMKQNNINAVRTCHYPDAKFIYDLCDEYGLYMIAENNMETHGIWDMIARMQKPLEYALPGDRENCLELLKDRILSLYESKKNHASIIIWSIGNESFGGRVPLAMADFFRELDKSRLVHYEGVEETRDARYPQTSDMYTQMYSPVVYMKDFLKRKTDKPLILCEYSHAMGNSCGALCKYTDLEETERRYQGGFIWDFVDQAVRKKNRFGEEYLAYGGDCGERPTDYDFSGNGIVNAQRIPYAKMQEVKHCYSFIKGDVDTETWSVKLRNLFLFTDLSEYRLVFSLSREGKDLASQEMCAALVPGGMMDVDIPFAKPDEPGEYAVNVKICLKNDTAWGRDRDEMYACQGILKVCGEEKKAVTLKNAGVQVVRGSVNVGVYGPDFEIRFSVLKGGISSYKYCGTELLSAFPRPNFWRAPTQNDNGNQMAFRMGMWKCASLYQTTMPQKLMGSEAALELLKYPQVEEKETHVDVTFKHWLPYPEDAFVLVTYRVMADGEVCVKLSMDPAAGMSDLPEFGFMLKLPADFDHVCFYGLGPAENYADRNTGALLGLYEYDVKDAAEHYLVPQETGNRTGVRYAQVTDHRGRGLRFAGKNVMDFSALPYTPEQLEEAWHPWELPRSNHTVVRCSMGQMGVGGDDSWGARTHDEFLIKPDRKLEFEFSFKGI